MNCPGSNQEAPRSTLDLWLLSAALFLLGWFSSSLAGAVGLAILGFVIGYAHTRKRGHGGWLLLAIFTGLLVLHLHNTVK